jgi:hypothetical protein
MEEQTKNEQTLVEVQPAEADKEVKGEEIKTEVSLGKFKDVQSLIQAYNSLQSEFTKRCQRIKELEGEVSKVDKATAPTKEISVGEEAVQQGITQQEKEQILKDYLKGIVSSKQKAILMDGNGIGVKTPVSKPKTIAEAGALAREIL